MERRYVFPLLSQKCGRGRDRHRCMGTQDFRRDRFNHIKEKKQKETSFGITNSKIKFLSGVTRV